MTNKVNPTLHLHFHQHQHWHQLCLQTGSLNHLCEMSELIHNMLGYMRNKNNKLGSFRKNWLISICLIQNIASKCKQGKECFEVIKEGEYDPNRLHKSASSCYLCKRSHLATQQELPKSWSKWRDDKRSLCQMILKKVALSLAMDRKSYWEAMILAITNYKFCSVRANFMQEVFEQFHGKFYSI